MKNATMILILAGVTGCVAPSTPVEGEETLAVSCEGKCDGLSEIRSLYRDVRGVDLGDLASLGGRIASDELEDALEVGGLGLRVDAPVAYGLSEDIEDRRTESLRDLDELVSGLAHRFGEQELTTQVNDVRRRHLQTSDDVVFVEAAFGLRGDLGWGHDVGGLADDGWARVGLGGGEVQARVIQAYPSEPLGHGQAMLASARATRGFVLPRDAADVRAMKPGEAFALRGEGSFGLNVGAGVPVFVSDAAVSYQLVVSGALRAMLEGTLDVQLARLEGDTVVVDVGTERATVRSARIALEDGWGVSGLVEAHVDLGGLSVDLGRILERALEKQLERKLNLVEAELSRTSRRSRISLARFRFDLGAGGEHVEEALAQALRGDVRLAQALAARGEPGVREELDVLRSGLATTSRAGIDLLGMSFFTETFRAEGSIDVQTPGGAQSLLFDTYGNERGSFFSRHGFSRVSLAGVSVSSDGVVDGETNLFVQTVEGDEWMQRDKLLDHLDAILRGVAGEDAFISLETPGNELERFVRASCRSEAFNPCYTEILSSATVVALRRDGLAAFEAALPADLTPDLASLALELAELRLTAQATFEPHASLVGPDTSIFVDMRLGDAALAHVFQRATATDMRAALQAHYANVRVDRRQTPADAASDRARALGDEQETLEVLVALFEAAQARYQRVSAIEQSTVQGLGRVGATGIEVVVPVRDGAVDLDAVAARSLAESRMQIARAFYDDLRDEARELRGVHPEAVAGYALLSVTPASLLDLRVDIDMKLGDNWGQSFRHYREAGYRGVDLYGRGGDAAILGGGVFDIDALLRVDDL